MLISVWEISLQSLINLTGNDLGSYWEHLSLPYCVSISDQHSFGNWIFEEIVRGRVETDAQVSRMSLAVIREKAQKRSRSVD